MMKQLILWATMLTSINAMAADFFKDGIGYDLTSGVGGYYLEVVPRPDEVAYTGDVVIASTPNVLNNSTGIGPWEVWIIRGDAFVNCNSLTSITLPKTLHSIWSADTYADEKPYRYGGFGGCTGLKSITLPASMTSLGECTFADCTSLKTLSIPENVSYQYYYGSLAPGCTSMTSITVDSKNEYLSSIDGVLYDKEATRIITCPAGKTSVSIAATVREFADFALAGCSRIAKVNIPQLCTSIGKSAFFGCTRLTSIECMAMTPPNVTEDAFESVTFKGTLTVPEKSIEAYKTHKVWGKFKTIKGVSTSITKNGFVYDIYYPEENYVYLSYNKSNTGAINIPETFTSGSVKYTVVAIGPNAFSPAVSEANNEVTSVSIPATVMVIYNNAFSDCTSLTKITVTSKNAYYSTDNDILYDKEKATLLLCPRGKSGKVSIPTGVTSISRNALENCIALTSVKLPSTVTTIGESAFSGCTSLTDLDLGKGVKEVADNAFLDCGLTTLTLPVSLETVNYCSFCMPSLRTVISHRLGAPFSFHDLVFSTDTYNEGTLFVEPGYVTGYNTARGFSNFKTILEFDPTNLEGIAVPESDSHTVYNLQGIQVLRDAGADAIRSLPNGIYIINGKKVSLIH